ncbi:hypothetical protein D9M71_507680 [compost metagenome]
MPPETPQVRLGLLLLGRRRHRHDVVLARIERPGHPTDRPALARRVVALEHRHQRVAAHALVAQQSRQARLLDHQLLLVAVLVQGLGHVQAVDQAAIVDARRHRRRMGLALG